MADSEQDDHTRQGLLERTREQHDRLEVLLAPLGNDELTRPGVTDGWSVKDHLAHLTWWARRVMLVVGGAPDPLEAMPGDDHSEDDINAWLYAANRDRTLADVRAGFAGMHGDLLAFIATLPDDTLAQHYVWISGNADWHYGEHARMFEAWRAGMSGD
ncbi:MAG: DinB family protein [Ktedonobacterales bacterium]